MIQVSLISSEGISLRAALIGAPGELPGPDCALTLTECDHYDEVHVHLGSPKELEDMGRQIMVLAAHLQNQLDFQHTAPTVVLTPVERNDSKLPF